MGDIGGVEVSDIALGCNNFGMTIDERQTLEVVDAALDAGITLFDTADVYAGTESERFLGRAIGARRDEVVIATKFGVRFGGLPGGIRPIEIRRSLEASLARLGTDYVDIYMLHYPASWMIEKGYDDVDVPIAETMGGLDDLVREGKVRVAGCSNFSAAELLEADEVARASAKTRFACVQNGMSLLDRTAESEVLPLCAERNIAFIPYFPLASGLLTGKYRRGEKYPEDSRMARLPVGMWTSLFSEENFDRMERLAALASECGRTLLELALSWLLTRPMVASVIAGATSAEQVRVNVVSGGWPLSEEELAAVDAALAGDSPSAMAAPALPRHDRSN